MKSKDPVKPNDEELEGYIQQAMNELGRGADKGIEQMTGVSRERYSRFLPKKDNLFSMIREIHSDTVPDGVEFMDEKQHQSATAIVETYGTYLFMKDKFSEIFADYNKYEGISLNPDEEFIQEKLIQAYSLFVATKVGLKRLENLNMDESKISIKTSSYKKIKFDFDEVGKNMNKQLKDSFTGTLSYFQQKGAKISSDDFATITKAVLESVNEKIIKHEAKDGRYKSLLDVIDNEAIEIKGIGFKGFSEVAEQKGKDVSDMPTLDMVIGMKELKEKGTDAINRVMTYDIESQENSIPVGQQKFQVHGKSGVGKGFCLMALARYAVEMGKDLNKPVNIIMMSPEKFKSSYMNESANNLVKMFNELYDPNSINICFAEEIDTMIAGRDAAKQAGRIEEGAVTGAFLRMLSTTNVSPKGNWLFFSDTNYIIDDPAVKSRLGRVIQAIGAQQPEEFTSMFKDVHLREGVEQGYLDIDDQGWQKIGELCSQYENEVDFSGRDVENICDEITGYANDFKITEEFLKMPYKEQVAYAAKNPTFKTVDTDYLYNNIKNYVESKKAAVDREAEERKKKKVDEWKEMDEAMEMYKPYKVQQFKKLADDLLPQDIAVRIYEFLPHAEAAKEEYAKKEEKKDE